MKKIIKILAGLLIVVSIIFSVAWRTNQNSGLNVYFFDVGQGDAILIRTPSRQNIIIDGGPDNAFITKLGQALPFYDRTIDLMILTHPHDDHLFGLVEVLKRYRVKQVLSSGVLHSTDAYLEWLSIIKEKEIPLKIALAGQKYLFDEVELRVLYPFKDYTNQKVDNLHDAMVVVQLIYPAPSPNTSQLVAGMKGNQIVPSCGVFDPAGGCGIYQDVKMLFTGDLEGAGETEILKNQTASLQSQVLKVGHHGSDTSSSQEFLAAIKPEYAVIQVGQDNKFGHPSRRIINRLQRQNVEILRTDLLGDVYLVSDGRAIWLK